MDIRGQSSDTDIYLALCVHVSHNRTTPDVRMQGELPRYCLDGQLCPGISSGWAAGNIEDTDTRQDFSDKIRIMIVILMRIMIARCRY